MLDFLKLLLATLAPGFYKPEATNVSPDRGTQVIIVKDGYKLEALPVGRPIMPRRVHVFEDTASFSGWLLKWASPKKTEILCDLASTSFSALLGQHYEADFVRCPLRKSPAFSVWAAHFDKPLTQDQLFRLISTRRDEVSNALAMLAQVANLDVKFTGESKRTLDPVNGVLKLSVVSQGTEFPVKLPAEIPVTIPVFVEGDKFALVVDLIPEFVVGRPPTFTLKPRDLEQTITAAFEAELTKLREALKEDWLVGRGTIGLDSKPAIG